MGSLWLAFLMLLSSLVFVPLALWLDRRDAAKAAAAQPISPQLTLPLPEKTGSERPSRPPSFSAHG
ncbi:MAG: hypothetical protein ACRDQZ_03105 [Mycobacteriales bacterium]